MNESDIEIRVAKLESDIESIKNDIFEIKDILQRLSMIIAPVCINNSGNRSNVSISNDGKGAFIVKPEVTVSTRIVKIWPEVPSATILEPSPIK